MIREPNSGRSCSTRVTKPTRTLATIFSLFIAVAGCGESGPTDPNGATPNGPMSARVDGSTWVAISATATRAAGFVGVAGASSNGGSVIAFGFPDAPGTYTIPGEVGLNFSYTASGQSWHAIWVGGAQQIGSGTLTVTSVTATRVAGTFNFTAVPVTAGSATGSRNVTDGAFDIQF